MNYCTCFKPPGVVMNLKTIYVGMHISDEAVISHPRAILQSSNGEPSIYLGAWYCTTDRINNAYKNGGIFFRMNQLQIVLQVLQYFSLYL